MGRPAKDQENIVVKAMKEKNLTQEQLAKKIGVNQQTVSKYITNISKNRLPRFARIETIYMLFSEVGLDPFTEINRILDIQRKEK